MISNKNVLCATSNLGKMFMRHKSSKILDISGVYPPITTPFDKDENIHYEMLKSNLKTWNSVPFKGYVIQGSTGEFAFLTPEERVSVIKFTKEHIGKDKLLIAGSGCESTRATIEMTRKMAEAGANACLVVTPSYYKGGMTDEALFQHYTKVADSSPVPIILYSVPANTSLDVQADLVIRLSTHPNIIGMKDSGGDVAKMGYIVHKTKDNDFQLLAGSGGFFLPALTIGCVGGIFGLANVLGKELCHLQTLAISSKREEARLLQHRLISPNSAVTKKFGIPGVKQAMDWFGLYGGPTRSPMQPLTPEKTQALRNDFSDNGFL